VVPPGTARPDWVIAVDLAFRLGADLGFETVDDVWAEIEQVAPAHRGLTLDRLTGPDGREGLVVDGDGGGAGTGPRLAFTGTGYEPPPLDSYSLRLVASRRLWDGGVLTEHSPSLARLASGTRLRVNPYDLDRLGVTTGARVRLSSAKGSLTMPVTADGGVPRGSAAMTFGQPGDAVGELIDALAPVTDVRIENV
jgi:predicted molibdopterin-dependent oxidoreductase YjgC